jgi:hypothetical protein
MAIAMPAEMLKTNIQCSLSTKVKLHIIQLEKLQKRSGCMISPLGLQEIKGSNGAYGYRDEREKGGDRSILWPILKLQHVPGKIEENKVTKLEQLQLEKILTRRFPNLSLPHYELYIPCAGLFRSYNPNAFI